MELGSLNLVFLAVALVALLIPLSTVRNFKEGKKEKHDTRVWAYLLSAVFAMWAVGGQLLTLGRSVSLAHRAGNLADPAAVVFQASLIIGAIAIVAYAWKTIGRQMEEQLKPRVEQPALTTISGQIQEQLNPGPAEEFALL